MLSRKTEIREKIMIYTKKVLFGRVVCILAIVICCFTGCKAVDTNMVNEESSEAEISVSESSSESSEVSSENPSESSVSSSTKPESSEAPSESSPPEQENSQVQPIPITPNADVSVSAPPQPDGSPQLNQREVVDEMNKDETYEAGIITISRVQIDGATEIVTVNDEEAKKTILGYVDTMQSSEYNAMNTPPGGDSIINVAVHRDDAIEQYIFSDRVVDNNALGKNLQDPDLTKWYIVDNNAFSFVLDIMG
jgi:cytoskeletal protein RodZ